MDEKKALNKCMQLCSKAEYSIFDIEQKLIKWEVFEDARMPIIQRLIDEKFLDEFRFVNAFVKDKFRFNRWGKTKISFMLKQKSIAGEIVREALSEIDDDDYEALIVEELRKKIRSVKGNSDFEKKVKVVRFLASRGFESELIYKLYDKHANNC